MTDTTPSPLTTDDAHAGIDETQRQAYLEAMGIDTWMPVMALPGAAAAAYFEWDQLAATPATSAQATAERAQPADIAAATMPASSSPLAATQTPASAPVASSVSAAPAASSSPAMQQALAAVSAPKKSPVVTPVSQPDPSQASSQPQDTLRSTDAVPEFHLAAMAFSRGVVVTDMPAKMSRLSAEHIALLQAMLSAVTQQPEPMGNIKYFHWPMVRGTGIDQSAAVARQTLERWLPAQCPTLNAPALLIMGEQAMEQILPVGGASASFGAQAALAGWQSPVATHGLHALLGLPLLKKDAWRHLQPLVRWCAEQTPAVMPAPESVNEGAV